MVTTTVRRSDRRGHPDGDARSGDGHKQVAELQRARLLTAMVQEVSERGAANVSVGHVVGRSGVSRRTFYEIFHDREECFLAAFDEALRDVAAVVVPAYERAGTWTVGIRSGLAGLLECFERDPAVGRLLIVESLAAGPGALARRQSVISRIMPIVERGSDDARAVAQDEGALTAEGVVGAVLSVLHARLVQEDPGGLLELLGPLMGMIVLPYLGPAAARKEIARPAPRRSSNGRPATRTDPLQDLPMRLTYRTMRVLVSVAEHPGSSNRMVGKQAGIGDQGQASKLLARLHKLGLVENQGGDPARGEPNAWVLTSIGQQVHESIADLGSSNLQNGTSQNDAAQSGIPQNNTP
jgi:AcrR family transcriptional regulator